MDLFSFASIDRSGADSAGSPDSAGSVPLAERLRPQKLEDMVGQEKLLGPSAAWRDLLQNGQIPSLILWGPPGTGKTTFANLLAQKVDAEFIVVSAIDTGAKRLREIGAAGRALRLEQRRRTLVFVDEIHRLNKGQQDVLLPSVEKGDVILVGATTENPSYELNAALLSRCRLIVFERLSPLELRKLIERATTLQGLRSDDLMTDEASTRLCEAADGDGRRLLNLLEVILNVRRGQPANGGKLNWPLVPADLAKIFDSPQFRYDRAGDEHYDTISAFIKSVRGSDPDAAVYYLARMLKGGEDPVFIARRLVILASEDISNADPRALTLAVSGLQAVELIGLPEASISLAQVTTYLASAPKSNRSYMALQAANELIEKTGSLPIPLALRSAKTNAMKGLGYGRDYEYSHNGEKGYVAQQFLPEQIASTHFYEPSDHGFEKNIAQYLKWLKS